MTAKVSRADLDQELAALRATIRDPRAGLFGPATMVWEVAREAVIFLGAGRAALLQLAHPYVASAIAQHSITLCSPQARFQRTFRRIFGMVFGDLEQATRSALDVYRVHAHVRGPLPEAAGPFPKGHTYDALDRDAAVWVLATLWDTSLWLFDRVVRPLSRDERARYYEESRRFARLFGLERSLPPSYDAFEAYVARTLGSDLLTVTRDAAQIGRHIMRPDNVLGRVLRQDFGLFTAHLLPEPLARGFGLERGGEPGRRRFERILELARRALPRLPPRLRYLPAYLDAERRLRGDASRDRVGELMTRLYLGRP